MNSELLVTGGSGLLGAALRELYPQATYVSSYDGDLCDPARVRALFERFRPKRVLHVAARVGGVKSNAEQNADLLADNLLINTNVLRAAQQSGVSRLVSVLSSCAFQLYTDRDSCEDDLHVGQPFAGNLGYGCSKRILDVQTRLMVEQYGVQFSTIAPVTMYGPHDNFDLNGGHVIGALIHKAVVAKETGGPLEVWGGGKAVRQFVYVKDVARILLTALDSSDGPNTVIVAPDRGLTIRELVQEVVKAVEFAGPVVFNADKPEGVLVKRLSSSRFAEKFPGFQFTLLPDGLKEAVNWFLQENRRSMVERGVFSTRRG
jgi:GDP-L-fucose synthase